MTVAGGPRTGAAGWAVLVVAVAAGLRLYGLASWPFEQDELYTLLDATYLGTRTSGPGVVGRPLYYLLQHALLELGPPTPLFLRLPAFLFGVLGVWLTYALGRRAFGPMAGIVAAVLLALSPWHLYSSQFARYWTLVYVWALLLCWALPRALDSDRAGAYTAALAALVGGWLTHPTFAFAALGVALAVSVVARDGSIGWRWPTWRAWLFLWGPLVATVVVHAVIVLHFGNQRSVPIGGGRGLFYTLRTVPAMVQWLGPEVAAAAAAGALFMFLRLDDARDRRWGAMTVVGAATTVGLILFAGLRSPVYADYGMAMLPLVFVTVGGAVQRVGEVLPSGRSVWALAATLVLALGSAPGTVSHLSDGTRYDYRPAYAYLARAGGGRPVLGWPTIIQRQYAPDLRFEELQYTVRHLERALGEYQGFWLLTSHARYGLVGDNGRLMPWIDAHCRTVLRTGRQRVDYRSYRVELAWCGALPPPAAPPM